ncbi:hypothetical protein FWC31_03350 [Candidatus Saccharibacteria bacterium]|nr:hypothetical protein [Candidatus Saccharibacteria bacterium]
MAISWFSVGMLTVICVLLIVVVIIQTKKLIVYIKNIKKKSNDVLAYKIIVLVCRVIALIVPLALIIDAGYHEIRWQYTQYVATTITRYVTGRDDITARCVRRLDFNLMNLPISTVGGVAKKTHSEINYNLCRILAQWLMSDREEVTNEVGWALHTIIHEAVHLTGEENEPKTECKSIMMHEDVAFETLGIDREVSRRFVEYYKALDYNDPTNWALHLALGYTVDWRECETAENTEQEQEEETSTE